MASNVEDKILWTAIIVSGIAACWYLPYVLRQVKESTAVSLPPPKPNKPQLEKDAEAAIEPSTLAELANGPSYNLAASAIRLTVAKFLKSTAKRALLRDLASKDFERRDKAINAFRLLLTNTALKEQNIRSHFNNDATFNALVTALVNLLPEHEKGHKPASPPASPIRPPNRSAHEAAILSFLCILITEPRRVGTPNNHYYLVDPQPAVNAGIITRWLKHYPFPCTLPENRRWNFKRHEICRLLQDDEWGSDDEPMSTLMTMLMRLPSGARQLADIGLRSASMHGTKDNTSSNWRRSFHENFYEELSRENTFGDDFEEGELLDDDEMMVRLQEAPHVRGGRTAGERSLRRRHRQAVVVAEAGMPLREENILQRLPTETELNWEEQVTGRQGEILRDRTRSGNRRSGSADEDVALAVDQIAMERIDGMEDGVLGGVWEGPTPPNIDLGDIEWSSDEDAGDEEDDYEDDPGGLLDVE